jgi:monoamine oxidase
MRGTVTRRSFVQGSLASSVAATAAPASTTNHADVLIIGAGMAGLSAAHALRPHGVNVIVLEARNRIGGRIWTESDTLPVPVDLGASFIHHAEDSPLTPFCEKHGIETLLVPLSNIEMFLAHHEKVPKAEVDDAIALFVLVLAGLQTLATSRQSLHLRDLRLSDAIDIVFKNLPPVTRRQRALFGISASWFIRMATGADPTGISLFNTIANLSAGQQDRAFPMGYRQVPEVLARGIDIRLTHIVEQIDYRTATVQVTTDQGIFTAPHVIVTLPIGVLQSDSVQFVPPLPGPKRAAIGRAQLGIVNKLFLQFSEQFWDNGPSLMMRTTPPDGDWPVFLNFKKIAGQPILMCFNSALFALATEALSLETLVKNATTALQTMFGQKIPTPIGAIRSQWRSDPFACGSYPFFPIGGHVDDRDVIAQAVESRLFFAGDGTRDKDPESTGAFRSGIRVAREVMAA